MFNRFKKYFAMLFVSLSLAGVIFPAVVSTTIYASEVDNQIELNQEEIEKAAAVLSELFYEENGKVKMNNYAVYKYNNYIQRSNKEVRKFIAEQRKAKDNGVAFKIDFIWLAGCALNETGKEIAGLLSLSAIAKIFESEEIKIGAASLIAKIVEYLARLGVKGNLYMIAFGLVVNAVRCEMGWT